MSQPVLTDVDFHSLGLHPNLLRGLDEAGFHRLTPIQALALPPALQGEDIAGQAQTGTGKTAAFLLAVMQRLLTQPAMADRRPTDPRALILAPTRELAIQIHKDAVLFGAYSELKLGLAYGGIDYDKQRRELEAGVDILIGTPGRLIDYLKQHVYSLRSAEAVVMDEADRMFDLGFIKDVRFLLRRCPPREQRQGMLFSATLSYRVMELAYEHMNEARKVEVESDSITAAQVTQKVYFPASEEKLPLLVGLMKRMDATRSIVFVNTKHAAEQIANRLNQVGLPTAVLSGDVPQNKRQTLLGRFGKGEVAILVATDVAARGLHIPDVSHVFNYDLPQDPEDYVHRIGRTARFGASGDAVSFACERYAISLPDIEAYIEHKIPVASVDPELLVDVPAFHLSKAPRRDDRPGGRGRSGGGGRSGAGGSGRGGRGRRGDRPASADQSSSEPSTPAPAETQGAASTTEGTPADGAAPKRRRRRRRPAAAPTPPAGGEG
ncbi:MAG: DEAD/DEAH box helicase [Xanthomonadales bacterium]|nr:DEAD/DEAH box helicase [Xanthomonadales bacterium]